MRPIRRAFLDRALSLPNNLSTHKLTRTLRTLQLDIAIVIYFTIEYLLRILLTTERVKFFLRPLNLVDLVSILPSYIELIIGGGNGALGLMRVLRVLRVFKLARHSAGLQVLAETAISARNELFQVFFCFSILAILFAAIVYYTEEQSMESREFVSIPHAMWWSVITLCTIGYGDMVPATGLGQAVGAMACVSGVVMVALPISVISQTFQAKFQEHTERQKMIERHNEQIRAEKERQKVSVGWRRDVTQEQPSFVMFSRAWARWASGVT